MEMPDGVELVLDARAELGEGPVWDARSARLIWVDIMRGCVHRFDPATGRDEVRDAGEPVGAAVPSADGSLVLATMSGFARLDFDAGRVTPIARVEADRPETRMNDGACDPAGRFWAGSMAFEFRTRPGAGALYRLDPDGRVTVMLSGVTLSNGIDWSPDGRLMYYVDSGTQRVDVFDFDVARGALSNRRPLVRIGAATGVPDGLTVDADGFIWLAVWGGAALHRYSPEGVLDRRVRMPVTQPSKCWFGGPDLADLYVTSAWIDLPAEDKAGQPLAGGLFRLRPGVCGKPGTLFGAQGDRAVRVSTRR
jgi:sugar lactone lactonase YvrE